MVKWEKFSVEERQDQDIGYRGKKPRGNILLAYNFLFTFPNISCKIPKSRL